MGNSTRITEPVKGRGSPPGRLDPISMRPNIWAVKDAVSIEEVARGYGEFKPSGDGRLLGRCVLPGHDDRTPSLTVYTDTQRFKCYGCGEHGDVLDLVRLVEGCEAWEAMVLLAQRYGVELPGRPDSWHEWNAEKARIRDAAETVNKASWRRRAYKALVMPTITKIEDPEERRAEIARTWKDFE